jgi:hypothetical protein
VSWAWEERKKTKNIKTVHLSNPASISKKEREKGKD